MPAHAYMDAHISMPVCAFVYRECRIEEPGMKKGILALQ